MIDTPKYRFDYFVDDLNMLACYYIDKFFRDKNVTGDLHSERYIDFVLNIDVMTGMDYIYNAVAQEFKGKKVEHHGQVSEDVRYVMRLFNQCAKRGIPKCFSVGIVMMYLELCKGYQVKAA